MFKKEILQIHDLISNDYTDLPDVPLQFCSPGLDQVCSRILGIDNFVCGYKTNSSLRNATSRFDQTCNDNRITFL